MWRITTCCTESSCYYKASDGKQFNCDGTDCNEAAQQLVDYMCKKGGSIQEYNNTVEQVLETARERDIFLR